MLCSLSVVERWEMCGLGRCYALHGRYKRQMVRIMWLPSLFRRLAILLSCCSWPWKCYACKIFPMVRLLALNHGRKLAVNHLTSFCSGIPCAKCFVLRKFTARALLDGTLRPPVFVCGSVKLICRQKDDILIWQLPEELIYSSTLSKATSVMPLILQPCQRNATCIATQISTHVPQRNFPHIKAKEHRL